MSGIDSQLSSGTDAAKMRLLLLYGLIQLGLFHSLCAQRNLQTSISPIELIVPPDPDDLISNDNKQDDPSIDLKFGVFENGISLCSNMANGSLLPYAGNCSRYIVCENGTGEVQDCCIDKLNCKYSYFDYEDQTCTDSDNQCLKSCEDDSLSTYCYDRTCTKYVICYYGIPVLRECRDGLQYNVETDRCDFPEYVDCVDNECSALIQPENIIFMASKANCSKYYICTDGRAWSQECSAGLIYNPEFKYCDFESNYKCPTSNIVKRNIISYSRSPPRRADITCPKRGVHFYAHKKRKNAYYYCVEGNGLTLDCTPGLLYDPDVQECRETKYINKQ